jgi:predicted DNA binding protein
MNTPKDLIKKLVHEPDDLDTFITIYKEAGRIIKAYEEVKEKARVLVKVYLERTGETSGRTAAGTFGLTRPTPTFQVNEEKWQAACAVDTKLAAIQQRFDAAQRALDKAQREFLEEVTPEPSVYIR